MCDLKKSNALDPTFGFMQYLKHLKFLEYFLGLKMKGVEMQIAESQIFMSYVHKTNV